MGSTSEIANHIIHDQDLTIRLTACTNANGWDVQSLANKLSDTGGDAFQHDGERACLLESEGSVEHVFGLVSSLALDTIA